MHRSATIARRRAGLLLVALVAVAAALAAPARAAVEGSCTGSATINGVRYTPANDTPSNPVIVPTGTLQVSYEGSTGFDNQGHAGSITLPLGPQSITIAEWADDNGDGPNAPDASGEVQVDDLRDEVPFTLRGLYEVRGQHAAGGNSCSGFVLVKFDGPVLDSPVALASMGTFALGLLLVLLAGLVTMQQGAAGVARGRPVLGVLGGLLLGLAGAVLLQQFSVLPPTTVLLLGGLAVGALLGLVLALTGPFGRGRVIGGS